MRCREFIANVQLIVVVAAVLALLPTNSIKAEGLLRISQCRIVDNDGPVKAVGVNYVDGFWGYSVRNEARDDYLPMLNALSRAKIPFIRMSFGPWAPYKESAAPAPQIADFVTNSDDYFRHLDTFLNDLKDRHIGVVLDVFWNVDPYTVFFQEPRNASTNPNSKTSKFLRRIISEIGERYGSDPEIWLIEFTNEANLEIDFPQAAHTRGEIRQLADQLSTSLRAAGDRHLIDSGNATPRPGAEHLAEHEGWTQDSRDEFLEALDEETDEKLTVASIHLYRESSSDRPWAKGDAAVLIGSVAAHSRKKCRPTFVGEFGDDNNTVLEKYLDIIARSDLELAVVWGFGRPSTEPLSFGIEKKGIDLLNRIHEVQKR